MNLADVAKKMHALEKDKMELKEQLSTHQALLEKMAGALEDFVEGLHDTEQEIDIFKVAKEAKQVLSEYQAMKKEAGNG